MDRRERSRGLPSLGSLVRHQFLVILTSVAFALGLAVILIVNSPATYTASAVVLLSPAPGSPLTAEAASGNAVQMTVAMETEAQLMRTPAVEDIVSTELEREVPGPGERLQVSVPSNTQMLDVSFTSRSPETAQEGAQAYADGYLMFRAERALNQQEARSARLQEQIAQADADLREAIAGAAAAGGTGYAAQQVQLTADRLAQLNSSLSAAQAVSTDPGFVINEAVRPEGSNELPRWLVLLAAGALGLLAGAGLALLREWRRDLLRDSDSMTDLGVPVLAVVRAPFDAGLAAGDPQLHEAYRQLRTAVIAKGATPHILAVTAVESESSAEVAANLAIVLAEAKFRVLLIATDSQERRVEGLFDIDAGAGLAEVVAGERSAMDVLVATTGISLLTAGLDSVNSRDLTASSSFRAMVRELHQHFDYVILAAATAGSADGDSVLLAADSALLILTSDTTSRSLVEATLDRLDGLDIATMGAVVVTHPRGSSRAARGGVRRAAGSDAAQPDGELVLARAGD